MRVVFYDCGYPSLGVQYLITALRARGHDVGLFFDPSLSKDYLGQGIFLANFLSLTPHQVIAGIMERQPEIVCVPMHSLIYNSNMVLIRALKAAHPGLIVVCGGIHATLVPHVVIQNPEVDFVVTGEAELSLPDLIDRLAQSGPDALKALPADALPGVWSLDDGAVVDRGLSPLVRELDTILFPEKRLHHEASPAFADIYTIAASRGCYNACTYCNSPTVNAMYRSCQGGSSFRTRSVDNVMAELHAAVDAFHPRHVEFFDDLFGARRPWLQEFCARYKAEIGLPYDIQTTAGVLDEEALDLLAGSGCAIVELGLQSVNPEVRDKILNRRDSNEDVEKLIAGCAARGISFELDIIVNLPGEKPEHLKELLDFMKQARPRRVNLAFLKFFPKTPIVDIALKAGMITQEDIARIDRGENLRSFRILANSKLSTR